MSFIAVLDGNEMKWKIGRKIKGSGERPRDKRQAVLPRKKDGRRKGRVFLFIVNIGTQRGVRVRNVSLPACMRADGAFPAY